MVLRERAVDRVAHGDGDCGARRENGAEGVPANCWGAARATAVVPDGGFALGAVAVRWWSATVCNSRRLRRNCGADRAPRASGAQ